MDFKEFKPQLYRLSNHTEFCNDYSFIRFIIPIIGNDCMMFLDGDCLVLYPRNKTINKFDYGISFKIDQITDLVVTDTEVTFKYSTHEVMDDWVITYKFKKVAMQ